MLTKEEFVTKQREGFEAIVTALVEDFGPDRFSTSERADNFRLHVPSEEVFSILKTLKEKHGFAQLTELSAADYLHYPNAKDRYGIWYILVNIDTGQRFIVKTIANDPDPMLPSVFPLWKGADWMEREIYDMYGIEFEGHPDLRRILLPDEFEAFPLRKDYPLRGKGERHNFECLTRAES